MNRKVYLAGPITGCSYNGCTDWREYAKNELALVGIDGFSPLRAKEYLASMEAMPHTSTLNVMSSAKAINVRDHYDCMSSDVILVNFLDAPVVSIGTVMEVAWGFAYRKPTVICMEETGNIHNHPMIRESGGFFVNTLEEGIHVVKAILMPSPTASVPSIQPPPSAFVSKSEPHVWVN